MSERGQGTADVNCEGMRVVVPGKQHSGEWCSSLGSVHLEGIAVVMAPHTINNSSNVLLPARLRSSTAGVYCRQRKAHIHSPTRARGGVLCIGVCACWMQVREGASSPGMLIDKRMFLSSVWEQRHACRSNGQSADISYTGSVQASRLLRKRAARLQLSNDRPLVVHVACVQARAGYGSPGKMGLMSTHICPALLCLFASPELWPSGGAIRAAAGGQIFRGPRSAAQRLLWPGLASHRDRERPARPVSGYQHNDVSPDDHNNVPCSPCTPTFSAWCQCESSSRHLQTFHHHPGEWLVLRMNG